jgi:myo-inositol 2-dehydrogenase/D-chiro-inositol 1-dehydrogenase
MTNQAKVVRGNFMRIGLIGVGRIGSFHASTLTKLPQVDSVVLTDVDTARARTTADRLACESADSVDDLLAGGVDALVVATATDTHAELIVRGVAAGVPVFCEKPVARDIDDTLAVIERTAHAAMPVQIGFQRRFDAGYLAAREATQSGSLGYVHHIRATTLDPAPPPGDYIASSGGFFADCAVHDFDAIRWVTGRDVTEVYAVGANRGEEFIRSAGDVDTLSAMLTLDDGTLALVSNSRYNAAGYDVRLELLGEKNSISVGLDDRMPLRSAQPGITFPAGPAYPHFMERFRDAYQAELASFVSLTATGGSSQCTMKDALEAGYIAEACEISRQRRSPVSVAEVRRADPQRE